MKKQAILFVIAASLLLTLLPHTVEAAISYMDQKPPGPLVKNWKVGVMGFTLFETKSSVSNLVVRASSDKKIRVWGDIEAYGGALSTTVDIAVTTAFTATVNVNSFTWNGLWKTHMVYSRTIFGGGDPFRFPGVELFAYGGGSGHFDVTISDIEPASDVFGVVVTIGNLGSALGLLWDIYKFATVPDASESGIDWINKVVNAIKTGSKIPLLFQPHSFEAEGDWPTETGQKTASSGPAGGTEILGGSVVYYDERYPTSWISRDEAKAIRNYLLSRGFIAMDADSLKTFMQTAGKYSVVVMAQDVAPDTIAETPYNTATIRKYLGRGGRVVWLEDIPFYYQGHSDGTVTEWGTYGITYILGIYMGSWDVGDTVTITADGSAAGLTQTWASVRPIQSWSVTQYGGKVYASASGGAAAWTRPYGPYGSGEFRRIWDNGGDFTSDAYLQDLATVATTGDLSWQVEMTAYNADSIYARCGDININGYKKRVISWISKGQTVTATTNVPGYWFNYEFNAINAWVTTRDQYDNGNSWTTVKLTSPEGFKIQYYKMKPANLDHKAYFELEMTGLWHVTTYRYYSSPTALAYNKPETHNYDTGSRTTGAFRFTVDLKLSATATLDFYHCYWTESTSYGAYDILRVQISTDLGETWITLKQWDSRDPNVETWTKVTQDISPYCGYFVQIRFYFDSVDSVLNNYEGWYIDDITTTATPAYLLKKQVSAGSDDCRKDTYEWGYQYFSTIGSYILAGTYRYYTGYQTWYESGMRFTNVGIPRGSTIVSAYLKLNAWSDTSGTTVNTRIKGEDTGNSLTFTDLGNYNARARTSAYADWDGIPPWDQGEWYTSPNLKDVIQEIVNRYDWQSSNALALFWADHGSTTGVVYCYRTATAYDYSAANAPTLEIVYAPP